MRFLAVRWGLLLAGSLVGVAVVALATFNVFGFF